MQSSISAAALPRAPRGATVLVVEDNPDATTIYSMVLVHSGFRVLVAADGVAGLALAREALPDVILMDIAMPELDGLSVTRALKADAATAGIPIVVLTAHALPGDRERALAAGADGYHTKPIEPRVVCEVIDDCLERHGAEWPRGAVALPLFEDLPAQRPPLL